MASVLRILNTTIQGALTSKAQISHPGCIGQFSDYMTRHTVIYKCSHFSPFEWKASPSWREEELAH